MRTKLLVLISLASFAMHAHALKFGGLGSTFGSLLGDVASKAGSGPKDELSVEEALKIIAEQQSKKLPLTMDSDTRWDSLAAGPGRQFTYHYTLTSANSSSIDLDAFKRAAHADLKAKVCSSQDMQVFFKYGVSLVYAYRANDGVPLSQFVYTREDCADK